MTEDEVKERVGLKNMVGKSSYIVNDYEFSNPYREDIAHYRIGDGQIWPFKEDSPEPHKVLRYHKEITNKAYATMEKKSNDYASLDDPYKNFRIVESIGLVPTEVGILVRMTDKISRLSNAVKGKDLKVKDESVQDTIEDLINYAVILGSYLEEKTSEH